MADTTTAAASSVSSGATVNSDYPKSIAGILKVVEMVLGMIAWICVAAGGYSHGSAHFFMFVSVTCWLLTLVLFFLFLFRVPDKISFAWNFTELVYGFAASILYLIASCTLAAYTGGLGRIIAAVVFGFFCLICYAVGTFLSFREWQAENDGNDVQQ